MEHIFILNPASGKGKSIIYYDVIKKIFKSRVDSYKIIETKKVGHAIEICNQLKKRTDIRVYSIGGDGTLNEIINGLDGKSIPIGVVPAGSGNDFVRTFYPKIHTDPTELINSLLNATSTQIDKCSINNADFCNISSIGFDALVTQMARGLKKIPFIPGNVAYLLAIFTALISFKRDKMEIALDDDVISKKIFLIAFGKGKYYGGGMKVLPNAEVSSNSMDVCIVHSISKLMVLFLFPKLIKGTHIDKSLSKYILYKKVKKIEIRSRKDILLNRDGELYDFGSKLNVGISSNKINLIIPENKE